MLTFRQYLSEGINIKGIRVPKPEVEGNGSKVYTYPGPTDVLQVAIAPEKNGAHYIMFNHGGSFGRSPGGVRHTTAQTLHLLNRVTATLRHHSRMHGASQYTYETADEGKHRLYQRMARVAGVNAVNLTPEGERFSRKQLGSDEKILSEIFRPAKQYTINEPGHPDLTYDSGEMVEYHYKPKDDEGKVIWDKTIRTTFHNSGEPHLWEVHFKVGGLHGRDPTQDFPSDVTRRVFDHFAHFVHTTRELTGKNPVIQYDTMHPKKHRIYQAGAKRLGIEAINMALLDPKWDRPNRG